MQKIKKILYVTLSLTILAVMMINNVVFAKSSLPEEGSYEIMVDLFHITQEKPSMGAKGLDKKAELVVKDGKMDLYIKAIPINQGTIETSLINCYYLKGNNYIRASRGNFTLTLPETKGTRPTVFSIPLEEKSQYIPVMVDPQVVFMGGVPLKARLKIQWETLKPIEKSELAEKMRDEKYSEKFVKNQLSASGISVELKDNNETYLPDLAVSSVLPKDAKDFCKKVGEKDGKVWDISINEPLTVIPKDKSDDIQTLRKPLKNISFKVYLPREEGSKLGKLYSMTDGKIKEINLKENGKTWEGHDIYSSKVLLVEDSKNSISTLEKSRDFTNDLEGNKKKDSNNLKKFQEELPKDMSNEVVDSNVPTKDINIDFPLAPPLNLPELPEVIGESVPVNIDGADSANVSGISSEIASSYNGEGSTDKSANPTGLKSLESKERPEIIFTILTIFLGIIISGITICRREMPLLAQEIERYKYLKEFERKVLK